MTLEPAAHLSIVYSRKRCSFSFVNEYIQEIIFRNTNIWDALSLKIIEDVENEDLISADHLLKKFGSFYELQMLTDDEWRFAGSEVLLKSGIKLIFDFNLSYIITPDNELLYEYASPIFEAFGYTPDEIRVALEESENNPLVLENRNFINPAQSNDVFCPF